MMYGVRRRARAHRAHAGPPLRLRGRAPGAHRQRRLQPAPARRLGHGAGLGLPAHEVARQPARSRVADPLPPGRGGDRRTGASPTAASGRCAASPGTSPRRRSCAGSPATAARGWRRLREDTETRRALAGGRPTRSATTILEHGVDERGVFVPALRHRPRWTRRCCSCRCVRFLPPDDERVRATVMAIADELTVDGLVLRYRVDETDDGMGGEEGTFTICSFWLVSRAGRDRRGAPRPRSCARSCSPTRARSTSTPRRSTRARGATWATSRRPSPTSR